MSLADTPGCHPDTARRRPPSALMRADSRKRGTRPLRKKSFIRSFVGIAGIGRTKPIVDFVVTALPGVETLVFKAWRQWNVRHGGPVPPELLTVGLEGVPHALQGPVGGVD